MTENSGIPKPDLTDLVNRMTNLLMDAFQAGVEYGALVEGYILGQKERVEKEQPKKVVTSDFPLHPTTCQCNGRGWFVEYSHREQCDNWDCVGCEKSRVACAYQ